VLWHRQPLPWCFEWTVGSTFPRLGCLGCKPWFPAPEDDSLAEVRRGYFPSGASTLQNTDPNFHHLYFQDASLGMVFREPLVELPIILSGMHPSGSPISFSVPEPPSVVMTIEGQVQPHHLHLSSLVAYPAENVFTMTYVARAALPRVFIPEIHADIPLSVSVNGDAPVVYQAPATIHNRLKAVGAAPTGAN
jgi:hypothetical protein